LALIFEEDVDFERYEEYTIKNILRGVLQN